MSSTKGHKITGVYLGELSAGTYSRLPPRMQAACREMVRLRQITIENSDKGSEHDILAVLHS